MVGGGFGDDVDFGWGCAVMGDEIAFGGFGDGDDGGGVLAENGDCPVEIPIVELFVILGEEFEDEVVHGEDGGDTAAGA